MENKMNNPAQHRPKDNRLASAQQVNVDLAVLLKEIKEEKSWEDSKRNAMTIFKTEGLRIVLIALQEGTEMARHSANGIISVQVLQGQLQFNTDRQSTELSENQMLVLQEQVTHSIKATKETVFLLTITSSIVQH